MLLARILSRGAVYGLLAPGKASIERANGSDRGRVMGYFLGCRIDRGSKQSDIAIPNSAMEWLTVAFDAPIVIGMLVEFRIRVASLLVKITSVSLHLALHVSWDYHSLATLIIVVLEEVDLLLR